MTGTLPGVRSRVLRLGPFSLRVRRRDLVVAGIAVAALLGAVLLQLCTGAYAISVPAFFATVVGRDSSNDFLVLDVGLPRYTVGALVGLALGASGSIFQTVTRNPLGSPDVVGFGSGAAFGALVEILVVGGGVVSVEVAAVAGGLLAALLVAVASGGLRHGTLRLVLTGVVISSGLAAVNSYLLIRAQVTDVQQALLWLTGSLSSATWQQAAVLAVCLVVLLPVALVRSRVLSLLEFDDEVVTGLGANSARERGALLLVGVLLIASATAAAGPVAFVALASPQIARRLLGGRQPNLLIAGLVGAVLVTVSDAIAQNALPAQPPVGIVTGSLGSLYLLVLLLRRRRARP